MILSHKIDAHHTIQEDSREVIVYISPSLHVVYTSIRVQHNERTMYGSGEKLKIYKHSVFLKLYTIIQSTFRRMD